MGRTSVKKVRRHSARPGDGESFRAAKSQSAIGRTLLKIGSPPQLRRGCWAEGPAGVVGDFEGYASGPSTASNHPDSSRRLLSAPPCRRRGATASSSSWDAAPHDMRGKLGECLRSLTG